MPFVRSRRISELCKVSSVLWLTCIELSFIVCYNGATKHQSTRGCHQLTNHLLRVFSTHSQEVTVKGLEPDIQRLIAKHKAEIKKLKSIHQVRGNIPQETFSRCDCMRLCCGFRILARGVRNNFSRGRVLPFLTNKLALSSRSTCVVHFSLGLEDSIKPCELHLVPSQRSTFLSQQQTK